jgi:hypothetical protein
LIDFTERKESKTSIPVVSSENNEWIS